MNIPAGDGWMLHNKLDSPNAFEMRRSGWKTVINASDYIIIL